MRFNYLSSFMQFVVVGLSSWWLLTRLSLKLVLGWCEISSGDWSVSPFADFLLQFCLISLCMNWPLWSAFPVKIVILLPGFQRKNSYRSSLRLSSNFYFYFFGFCFSVLGCSVQSCLLLWFSLDLELFHFDIVFCTHRNKLRLFN